MQKTRMEGKEVRTLFLILLNKQGKRHGTGAADNGGNTLLKGKHFSKEAWGLQYGRGGV